MFSIFESSMKLPMTTASSWKLHHGVLPICVTFQLLSFYLCVNFLSFSLSGDEKTKLLVSCGFLWPADTTACYSSQGLSFDATIVEKMKLGGVATSSALVADTICSGRGEIDRLLFTWCNPIPILRGLWWYKSISWDKTMPSKLLQL